MNTLDKAVNYLADRIEGAKLETLARYQAGLGETVNALRVQGARAVPLFPGSQLVSNSRGRVVGWSLRETTGSAGAVVRLRAGRDSAADILAPIAVAAGGDKLGVLPSPGVSFGDGLYLEVVSGSVEGAVYIGAVD